MVSSITGPSLLSYYQGQTALSMLSGSASGSSTAAAATSSALLSYLTGKEGIASAASTSANVKVPTAPWSSTVAKPSVSSAVQNAVNGAAFVDPSSAKLDAPAGVNTSDYQDLFALYQGLNTLNDIAQTAAAAGTSSASSSLSSISSAQLQSTFVSGMNQVQNFLSNAPFNAFNLTSGKVNTTVQSTVGIPNGAYQTYTTGIIGTGQEELPLKALQGNVQFTISVANKYATTTITKPDGTTTSTTQPPTTVNIDLSGMGSKARTIDNVVNYINTQLSTANVSTRFSIANLGNATVTSTVGGQTTTTKGDPQWGFSIKGSSAESVSFSAPSTAAAVYVSMGTGGAPTYTSSTSTTSSTSSSSSSTTPTGEQMMKLQTGNNVVGTAPTPISNAGNTTGLPVGGVFAKTLPDGVDSVQASATASDGSVYLLADVSGSLNNASVAGTQGVALLKYDAAGKLLYTKQLAGLQTASGYSLAVNTDGSVAVAGTNTTNSTTTANGVTTAGTTSAFVQVFDSTGAPSWSQTIPATAGGAAASGVVFGADGSVYVSGATTGMVGNQIMHGASDEFIQGFTKAGVATFTTQFGSSGDNTSAGMAYDSATNALYTLGTENGKAVVRSFSLNGTHKPTPVATRTLGSATGLVGIAVTNGQVVVGGNVSTATINAATVAKPYTGVGDGFIATLSTNLTAQASDTVTYLGKSGATQTATALSVAGGQAYLTGTIANDPSSLAAIGATEGFVTGVDTSSGAVSYSSTFAGANGQAVPTAVSVSSTGTSVLDQLGLPQGALNPASSGLLTAATAIKAGDSFYLRTTPGGPQTKITITAKDTLATLATKLTTAMHGSGTATVVAVGSTSQLSITPNNTTDFIELDPQQASSGLSYTAQSNGSGTNVLSALGLPSGVIRTVATVNNLTDVKQLREYGLNLPTNLNLNTATDAQHASNAIQAAMYAVKQAYQDLVNPPTMASEQAAAAKSSGGSVPTYLTNQIANYSAGLARLTAGQTSTSSSASSGGILSLFR
ncbi:MAG: regulatory protein FlaEY [Caulobacteraceae bacterium]|nr:regulatory protein FlaEY [Caulobacteraceae bacterium]